MADLLGQGVVAKVVYKGQATGVGCIISQIKSRIDTQRPQRVARLVGRVPVISEVLVPLLDIGPRVDMRTEAAQLTLPP